MAMNSKVPTQLLSERDREAVRSAIETTEGIGSHVCAACCDLFACGCYLILVGQNAAGIKACRTALFAFGFLPDVQGPGRRIINKAKKFPSEMVDLFGPHSEIRVVLRNAAR